MQSLNWLVATGLIRASAMVKLRVQVDVDLVAIINVMVILLVMFA
jgi:hypothetical protein